MTSGLPLSGGSEMLSVFMITALLLVVVSLPLLAGSAVIADESVTLSVCSSSELAPFEVSSAAPAGGVVSRFDCAGCVVAWIECSGSEVVMVEVNVDAPTPASGCCPLGGCAD